MSNEDTAHLVEVGERLAELLREWVDFEPSIEDQSALAEWDAMMAERREAVERAVEADGLAVGEGLAMEAGALSQARSGRGQPSERRSRALSATPPATPDPSPPAEQPSSPAPIVDGEATKRAAEAIRVQLDSGYRGHWCAEWDDSGTLFVHAVAARCSS